MGEHGICARQFGLKIEPQVTIRNWFGETFTKILVTS